MSGQVIFWIVWAVTGICMLIYYARSKRPLLSALKGSLTGVLALAAANLWGGTVGLFLSLNLFHVIVALVLGVPGVILLEIMQAVL